MPRRDVAKTSSAVSVATSSTVVAIANPDRQEIVVVNDGANIIYLQLSTVPGVAPTAVANQGARIAAGGGSWSSAVYTGPVAAIALTGATVMTVMEV